MYAKTATYNEDNKEKIQNKLSYSPLKLVLQIELLNCFISNNGTHCLIPV